jgi:hypothetical protein
MEAKSNIVLHRGSRLVTRAELAQVETPVTTRTYRAVAFPELVEVISDRLAAKGITIEREQLALNPSNNKLFGLFDLTGANGQKEYGRSLGFRTSHDRSLAIHLVVGARIFICDNLALSGESQIVRAAHYRRLSLNYEIDSGLDRYFQACRVFDHSVGAMKSARVDGEAAKALIFDIFQQGILSHTLFNEVASNFFKAQELGYEDCIPRSQWGAHNACTRALKGAPPQAAMAHLQRLGRFFSS